MQRLPHHRDLRPVPDQPGRRLPGVLALRDIPDVEQHVTSALERLSLPVVGEYSDRLVLAGVDAVFRVDRSVPREHPLAPVLDGVLEQGLLELAESEQPGSRLRAA
jgi:hypothetical protein